MIDQNILNKDCVILDSQSQTKDQALLELAELGVKFKVVKKSQNLFEGFLKRESEFSTGLESGFAIPHAKISEIKKPMIFIVRYGSEIEWGTLDNSKVKVAIALMIPQNSNSEHLALMSNISQRLLAAEVKKILKTSSDPQEIIEALSVVEVATQATQNYEGYLIAITGCPAGVAHTYMAAKKLKTLLNQKLKSKSWKTRGGWFWRQINKWRYC
ncbi:PTS sugar transporter subunit IIA [Spiroplasma clarkii]|uniref:PTS sugar transporter subunit IIA n=1 Tax=Spiroplasma clarkii TaxID=2139 RepID=UPI001F001F4A|nr:PTS sugar transporter subunit IIA [Spiroplasma clarkii]